MKHSLTNRIIIGKTIGLVAGLSAFFIIRPFLFDIKFGLGVVFSYIMLGVLTAFWGILDYHPLLHFKMPWWLRGIIAGLITHLILILVAYDQISFVLQEINLFGVISPWWILIDGAILGIIMEFVETKYAGEGKRLSIQ